MITERLISYFIEQWVVFSLLIVCLVNYPNKPLRTLSLIVFAFSLINMVVYDTIYHLGNPKITWNISWMAIEFAMFLTVYLKRLYLSRSKRDIDIMIISCIAIIMHCMQFLDWNFNGQSFMPWVMRYVIPAINIITILRLSQDFLSEWSIKILDQIRKPHKRIFS